MTLEVGTVAAPGLNEGGGSHAREGKNHAYPRDRTTVCVDQPRRPHTVIGAIRSISAN